MKLPFLKNEKYKYKKTEVNENLKELIKTMGLKPSEDNLKIFRTYLGIEKGRKPLENEAFSDYYKRTLKLFMKDMQKEAKRKVEEEGKKPIVNGKDTLFLFDNLMHSIAELHNDEVEKKNQSLSKDGKGAEPTKKDGAAAPATSSKPIDDKPLPSVNITQSKPSAETPQKSSGGGGGDSSPSRAPLFGGSGGPDISNRYGWHQFDEEDIHAQDKVEEYMRRVRTFQRINIERYVCYDPLYAYSFLNSSFKFSVNGSSSWWVNLDPELTRDIAKEEMKPSFNVGIDKKGNVKDKKDFLNICKQECKKFIKNTDPRSSRSMPSNEVVDDAYGVIYDVCNDLLPTDKKNSNQLGLTDASYADLVTETQFEFAVDSIKELYGARSIDPFDSIKVKDIDKGENNSKSLIALSFYRGAKELLKDQNLIYKAAHKADYNILKKIDSFLTNEVGLSKEFIKDKLVDDNLFKDIKTAIKEEFSTKQKITKVKETDEMSIHSNINSPIKEDLVKGKEKENPLQNKSELSNEIDIKQQEPVLMGPKMGTPKNNKKNN